MKQIPLSQHGKNKLLNLVALVDDDMYDYLNQWNWYALKSWNTFYAARNEPTPNSKRKQKAIWMHREILGLSSDLKKEGEHIDHNGLNNLRYNLRVATHSQNCINRRAHKNSSSSFLGVYKVRNKWRAAIMKDYKRTHIGYFDNEKIAAIAYNEKAVELFGEFANLNKITA